jgi:hypothetical protein
MAINLPGTPTLPGAPVGAPGAAPAAPVNPQQMLMQALAAKVAAARAGGGGGIGAPGIVVPGAQPPGMGGMPHIGFTPQMHIHLGQEKTPEGPTMPKLPKNLKEAEPVEGKMPPPKKAAGLSGAMTALAAAKKAR